MVDNEYRYVGTLDITFQEIKRTDGLVVVQHTMTSRVKRLIVEGDKYEKVTRAIIKAIGEGL